jgi:putative endonuclease
MNLARLFTTKQRGDDAERVAEQYLVKQGLKLVARNYRCRHGEVDLIMQHGAAMVFVEVRLREPAKRAGGNDFGGAAASITAGKQQRLIAAAQHYLAGLKQLPACRFDAVLLNQASADGIEWIQDAFAAG